MIDRKFRKAELDTEGHEIRISSVYELDATYEVQEADGTMKLAELDVVAARSESPAASATCRSAFNHDLNNMGLKAKVLVTALDWEFMKTNKHMLQYCGLQILLMLSIVI